MGKMEMMMQIAKLVVVAVLAFSSLAQGVVMDWVTVGNPGNANDTRMAADFSTWGGVAYTYQIGKYEVTNSQYAEFLNAKAVSDPYLLYTDSTTSNPQYG